MKFLLSTLFTGGILPFFLMWGKGQADAQIDKMQEAAFNTPGMESPVPPQVMVAGIGLLVSHFVFGQLLLRLKNWQVMSSLLLGSMSGVVGFFYLNGRRP